ncbi:hypothetical protein MNEG_12090, partial [Monoraphidium neglectum]
GRSEPGRSSTWPTPPHTTQHQGASRLRRSCGRPRPGRLSGSQARSEARGPVGSAVAAAAAGAGAPAGR